jgi:hypothetical protein
LAPIPLAKKQFVGNQLEKTGEAENMTKRKRKKEEKMKRRKNKNRGNERRVHFFRCKSF